MIKLLPALFLALAACIAEGAPTPVPTEDCETMARRTCELWVACGPSERDWETVEDCVEDRRLCWSPEDVSLCTASSSVLSCSNVPTDACASAWGR